nr:hypothetical protein [Tanacetum cinerariifolium]
TVHDGQIVTEPAQRKAPGNVGNNGAQGKKMICFNCRGHVSRQCKEPKRKMDSQYFKDKMMLMKVKEKGATLDAEAEAFLLAQEMHQEEHLGFDDEYDFLTNTIPYKKLSLVCDAENVLTEASAATSDQIA